MIKTLMAGTAMLGIAGIANAIPTLYVSTTGLAGSYTAVASSATGAVSFSGGIGVWSTYITSGITKPANGSATQPVMDIDLNASSTAGGSLWIAFADTGFSDALGGVVATITGHVVSGASESYSFLTYDDTSNSQPTTTVANGSLITTLSGSMPPNANASANGILPSGAPSTLIEIIQISSSGATSTSTDVSLSSVPDGGATALLLGAALSGLALLKRKVLA